MVSLLWGIEIRMNNYLKKIEKHELGQKELNPALVTDLLGSSGLNYCGYQ